MAEPVGTLRVAVEGDTAVLSDDMDRAYRIGEKFGQSIRGAFTGAIGAVHEFLNALGPLGDVLTGAGIGLFLQHSMELADQLDDTAKRLNVNVEALQAFQVAALESGIKTAALERGLNRLTDQVGNALQNNKAAIESFAKLGVAVTNVNGQTRATEAILADVVRALAEMEDQTKAAAIANDLFGRGGAQLAIALREAATDTDAYIARLKEAGLVLDEQVIKKAGEAADKMELAGRAFQMVGVSIMANLSPALLTIMSYVDEAIKGLIEMGRVVGLLAPDADELARRLGEIGEEIKRQQQLASYGNVGAAQYVEVLKKQRDQLRAQLRTIQELEAAERRLRAGRQGEAPPGPVLQFVPPEKKDKAKQIKDESKAIAEAAERDRIAMDRAEQAGVERYRAMYKREGEEHYRTLEEFNKLELADRQKTLDAKTKLDFEAAKYELRLQEEHNAAVNAYRLEAYRREEAEWAKRLELYHAGFESLSRALTGTVSGILQGTQTIGQAFERLGQNVLVSITETMIAKGLKVLEEEIEKFIRSEDFQRFISFLGSLGGTIAGAFAPSGPTVEANQTIYMGYDPMQMASGGIVQSPTLALIGEAGPEAVVPLSQGLAEGPLVQVNISNQHPTAEIQHQSRRGTLGNEIHEIVIREMRRMIGTGEMETVMAPYNLRRQPTGR